MPYMKWKARHAEIIRLKRTVPAYVVPFPDLSTHSKAVGCSNRIIGTTAKRGSIEGARTFPIGHNHKQGTEMITPGMMAHLAYLGGKKT